MGSWNHTCMVSQMHILEGEPVVEFWMVKQSGAKDGDEGHYTYSNAVWNPYPIPLYGLYADYGETGSYEESSSHDLLLKMITRDIVERDIGENQYHDHEVRKEGLTFERLHTIDHGGRGLIKWAWGDRALKHAVMKRSLFEKILDEHYMENYVRDETAKYGGRIVKVYFKDIIKDLEEGVRWVREDLKDYTFLFDGISRRYWDNDKAPIFTRYLGVGGSETAFSSPNYFDRDFKDLSDAELTALVLEGLKFQWVSYFISVTRKTWAPQVGQGSQQQDNEPYELLANWYHEDIAAQKVRWGNDEEDEED